MSVLVGRKAPDFTAAAVLNNHKIINQFNLYDTISHKYGLIFFYPMDFTFVCPTELIALNNKIEQFKNRNVEVIGISNDSQFVHYAWRNTDINNGGIGQINFTLVADVSHKICRDYGIEYPDPTVAMRAAFIIDKQGIVRSQIVNDLPLGRNIDEILRTIDALQYYEKHGEVCPAGWKLGLEAFKPTTTDIADYLTNNANKL
jgi:peroxiredoxin (alkyl hydroperoxide reductase subunit C)